MNKKIMMSIALAATLGFASSAQADDPEFSGTMLQCNATTCTVYQCERNPETLQVTCTAVYSYPRPREMDWD
jgi:hypothetical protein